VSVLNRILLAISVLLTTGCASTLPAHPTAPAPTKPIDSIHTLIRQMHLDYGTKKKTPAWNEIKETATGLHSTQSIYFSSAHSSITGLMPIVGGPTQRMQNHHNTNRGDAIRTLALEVARARKQLERTLRELTLIVDTFTNYCRDNQQGQLYELQLSNNEDSPVFENPVDINEITNQSQSRLICVTGQEYPFATPFFVDFYGEDLGTTGTRLHLSAMEVKPALRQTMMSKWIPIESSSVN